MKEFSGKIKREDIGNVLDESIKWTRAVKNDLVKGKEYTFNQEEIKDTLYRPFVKKKIYFSKELNEMQYLLPKIFKKANLIISLSGTSSSKPFSVLAAKEIFSYDLIEKTQCVPLYYYDGADNPKENITDWALGQFQKYYKDKYIIKDNIFHYVYAVLHYPSYRSKYEQNLKREFPRLPYYENFWQWEKWGKALMDLHLNYEQAEPYALHREDKNTESVRKAIEPRLMARKGTGIIEIDTLTTLRGVPGEAWDYRLGTYSAIEWILERYKEKTPKDPTIREKFNTYRFADYKEKVIDLIMRVCTVSVETMKIIKEMP
jgi:predicted helicase